VIQTGLLDDRFRPIVLKSRPQAPDRLFAAMFDSTTDVQTRRPNDRCWPGADWLLSGARWADTVADVALSLCFSQQ
jgi:hypothetical protein